MTAATLRRRSVRAASFDVYIHYAHFVMQHAP
jgi:hypothetical protein